MSETKGVDQHAVVGPHADQHDAADEVRDTMPTPSKNRTTAPAFQFYPKDFLSSTKVDEMSMTERGIYITLLARCWMDDGLPTDMAALAKMARMKPSQFERIWSNSPLHKCFYVRSGFFRHERLDTEKQKQVDFHRRQSDNGKMGGRPPKEKAVVSSGLTQTEPKKSSASSSASSSAFASSEKKSKSAEPHGDSTPIVLTFMTVGSPSSWNLHHSDIAKWSEMFPNVGIEAEARKAWSWIDATPQRRKTARGMPAFLVGWFGRAVDRGGRVLPLAATGTDGRGRTGAPPRGKYDAITLQDEE